MCHHQPRCPRSQAPDHLAARIVADQPGQDWSLLCNGVIVFYDGGELLPDCHERDRDQVPGNEQCYEYLPPRRPGAPAGRLAGMKTM